MQCNRLKQKYASLIRCWYVGVALKCAGRWTWDRHINREKPVEFIWFVCVFQIKQLSTIRYTYNMIIDRVNCLFMQTWTVIYAIMSISVDSQVVWYKTNCTTGVTVINPSTLSPLRQWQMPPFVLTAAHNSKTTLHQRWPKKSVVY